MLESVIKKTEEEEKMIELVKVYKQLSTEYDN